MAHAQAAKINFLGVIMKKLFTLITLSSLLLTQPPAQAGWLGDAQDLIMNNKRAFAFIMGANMVLTYNAVMLGEFLNDPFSRYGREFFGTDTALGTLTMATCASSLFLPLQLGAILYIRSQNKKNNIAMFSNSYDTLGKIAINPQDIQRFLDNHNQQSLTKHYGWDDDLGADLYTAHYTKHTNGGLQITVSETQTNNRATATTTHDINDIIVTLQSLLCGKCSD